MADVQSGKVYLGFYCRKCAKPLPIAEDPSGGKVQFRGSAHLRVKCQSCGHEDDYPAAEAQHLAAHTAH